MSETPSPSPTGFFITDGNLRFESVKMDAQASEPLVVVERDGNIIQAVSMFIAENPVDEKRWRWVFARDGSLTLQLWNDAKSAFSAVDISRTGIEPEVSMPP